MLDEFEVQLTYEPTVETRHRNQLIGLISPWDQETPVWELQVGDFRVFYEVDVESSRVLVRAIRRKLPHQTTEDIL